MAYSQSSPYYLTDVYNNEFLDLMNNRSITSYATDTYWEITATYNLRPDLLAYDLYGEASLWWVFIQRNLDVLQDPILDFVPGTKIYIPKNSKLRTALGI